MRDRDQFRIQADSIAELGGKSLRREAIVASLDPAYPIFHGAGPLSAAN